MKIKCLVLSAKCVVGMLVAMATFNACAAEIPWRLETYTLTAREMNLREALDTFGVAEGIPVIASERVNGSFSGSFVDVPASEFLDRIATMHNLTWYYDGASLYVYSAGEIFTTLTDLQYMKATDVRALLKELGVEDERFPIKTAMNDEIIMVSGPPRYVQIILQTIERADRLKELRTFNEIDTRIFPLKHTWADNVNLQVTGPETTSQIKGVAQMLQEIMVNPSLGNLKEASETNKVDTAESRVNETTNAFQPIIRAENRLNAVVVRDSVTRMPMYEKLINDLDRPQKLVEIAVTTVEMTKKNALDWQLSLAATGSHSDMQFGAGQNPSNLFTPSALAGKGLAGAFTYLGDNVDVSASLQALRQKGKARDISRTSLLTLNNMAAELSDTQSYHARVVGTEVANLQEVKAGTRLGIKPRVVMPSDTNMPIRVWLTLELQDGGFDSISVDSMPMTRQSTLETQASVLNGQSILLAGYFRDIREEAGWGIPYLRDIPLLGWLFGGSSTNKETVQRLFIITPYVLDIGPGETVREQAARARDITFEERLDHDRKLDDEASAERDMKIEEEDKVRTDNFNDKMKREKKELEFREQKRQAKRKETNKAWKKDFDERREAWEEAEKAKAKEQEK